MMPSGKEPAPPSSEDETLLQEEVSFIVEGEPVSPARRGYTAVYNYALYFWRPYLGNTAFGLWELLLSFCYGDKDVVYPSISRLARMLSNSEESRRVLTGRQKSCGAWGDGALTILMREHLVQVWREGEGTLANYTFRVCKVPPLLRPEQVARLCPSLQRDHARWLRRYGIDRAAYEAAFASSPREAAVRSGGAGSSTGQFPLASGPLAGGPTPGPGAGGGGAAGHSPVAPSPTNNPQDSSLLKKWWKEALAELAAQLRQDTFHTCLSHTRMRSFENGVLTLQAPTPAVLDFLRHRLAKLLQRTLHDTSHGQVREIRFE